MNVISLKEYMINDKEKVIDLLNACGFENIKYHHSKNEIRCSRDEGRNPSSVRVNLDTLGFKCYSTNDAGDIITLIQTKKEYSFSKALRFIRQHFKLEDVELEKRKYPFGGFYKKLLKSKTLDSSDLRTYPETILDKYRFSPNLRFVRDKICVQIQEEFKIGYDLESLRITLPWRNSDGELVGVVGRLNHDEENSDIPKYLALVPFPKSLALYGFSEDYSNLLGKTIFVAEAEKSKLIAKSIGINNVLSLGSHNTSPTQIKMIKSLHPKNIVLAFDEGIDEEYIREECKKFLNTSFFKYKVGYFDNKILPKDSKLSPFDLGENIKHAVRSNVKWLEN